MTHTLSGGPRRRRRLALLAPASVLAALVVALVPAGSASAAPGTARDTDKRTEQVLEEPLVFAHRGASGYRPEHTLEAYRLAIRLGADYIEPDLVSTKDGVLVARHENEIGGTTDVAEHPEFADRETTRVIDGVELTGWFTEDFTLAELKTLRAIERVPSIRPRNTRYDGRFEVPTLDEILAMVRAEEKKRKTTIGVAPETKHPTYFDSIGLSLEEPLLADLRQAKLVKKKSAVLIQSFEISNLRELDTRTDLPLLQLLSSRGAPYDQVAAGTGVTYADMVAPAGLRDIAEYAEWVGPDKGLVLPRDASGAIGAPSALVEDAHDAGLLVVVYTIRDENQFLPTNYQSDGGPNDVGDVIGEITAFLDAGVDGLFADYPDSAVFARDQWVAAQG